MSIFFAFLALVACLSLAASCEDKNERDKRDKEVKAIASLIQENLGYESKINLLETDLDSLGRVKELLQKKNQALFQENQVLSQEIKKNNQEIKNYRHEIAQLQTENQASAEEITELRADKQASVKKIAKLGAEFAEISADRDRLRGLNENLQEKLVYAQQIFEEVREAENSVRLMVGTEKLLEGNGFLKTSESSIQRKPGSIRRKQKQYKLVGKPKSDDPHVKLVPINQQLRLTLQAIPKALVDRSGKLKLKALVDRSGKLEKGRDYKVSESRGTMIITFTNRVLAGTDVLAVVEIKN